MAFNYNRMASTADRLINNFAQGAVEYQVITSGPPANPWDPPVDTVTTTSIKAVVRGVSDKFVDGVTILASDLQMLTSAVIDVGAVVVIDGVNHAIIRHDKIPAAGVTVTNRYILR